MDLFIGEEMSLTRQQRRALTAHARYNAGKLKPPTRKQAKAWLAPIRSAFAEMRSGYVDSVQGYAVTRLHTGDDYARIDYCINGFLALMERLMPNITTVPLHAVSVRLANGVPLTIDLIDACSSILNQCEDGLIKLTRQQLLDAAMVEQVKIEMEQLGLLKAA